MSSSYAPILAIDTAAAQCGVAIVADECAYVHVQPQQRGQSEALMPMILDLLSTAGMAMSDIAAIAVTTGPGSFTGLRVGLAAAHGLALALGIPAVGIDSFAAFAASLPAETADRPRAVIIESRRAELYWRLLGPGGAPLGEPASSLPHEIAAALQNLDSLLCGDGCDHLRPLLPGHDFLPQGPGPGPAAIARLGLDRLRSEGAPGTLPAALYIRAPDAKPAQAPVTGAP